jgi:putative aldouronate transport system substrate-binding protein
VNHPTRRQVLALMGLGAATIASGGALAACSKPPSSGGAATDVTGLDAILPKYQPLSLVKPDIPGTRPMADGFLTYPANLVDAVTTKPGTTGQKVTAMTPWWGPTPPGLGSNAYYAAINSELGVDVEFSVQDGNTYADKLAASLGARDVPDLLCIPSWEYPKIPRFSEAVKTLFEDLTDYLKGDAVLAYPMLANLPTEAWRHAVWGGRLVAIPWPNDGTPFPWALFYRKDLFDAQSISVPKTMQELVAVGKQVTDQAKGVWAFNNVFDMVQMFHKVPGSEGGWRRNADGSLTHKYETPEYRTALEATAQIYKDGLVHPDLVASEGGDAKQLFRSGKILFMQDGPGAWQGMQRDESKVTPSFNMQPVPVFSASGGDPLVWRADAPVFYTFIKKGQSADRVKELLGVLNWAAAPLGTKEFELLKYGKEGTHFTRAPDGAPAVNDLAKSEIADQFFFIAGRSPAIIGSPETPNYVKDLLAFANSQIKYLEPNPWQGIKLEWPSAYSAVNQPTEDAITDIVRGRRPVTDLDSVVAEWKAGGDVGRDFLRQALADNGR